MPTPPAPRARSLLAPIGSWLTRDEIAGDLREVSLEAALRSVAERREMRRARRLYAQLRSSLGEPPRPPDSAECRVYVALLYANRQRRLRLTDLVRRTGLPRQQLLTAVRRLREQGYVQFGVEGATK